MSNDANEGSSHEGPEAGHDPAALAEAARKMKVDRSRSDTPDPAIEGGHDPAALAEAARKMRTDKQ